MQTSPHSKTSALVVGANGFLGQEICRQCIDRSWSVDALYHTKKDNIPLHCRAIPFSQIDAIKDVYDIVFLAAGNFSLSPSQLVESNITLTHTLSQRCPSAKLVFVSSVSVYGNTSKTLTENSPFISPSQYGKAKIAGEFVTSSHQQFANCRLSYLYGPGLDNQSFLPTILQHALKTQKITLHNQKRVQDYLHVKDAASLCIAAGLHKENGTFLGASGKSYTNAQIARKVQKEIPHCQIILEKEIPSPSFRLNSLATQKMLGWTPQHDILQDIPEIVRYENSSL